MEKSWVRLVAYALAALVVTPGAAQVRVIVDGKPQDIPAGVVRTIRYAPDGRETIRDEPFRGQATPGAATITTTETTDEDERGRVLTTVETRIEPIVAVAYAPPVAPGMQSAVYSPNPYAPGPYGANPYAPAQAAPQLALDTDVLDTPDAADSHPQPMRVRRDPETGHFVADVRINGVKVRAIVDTGAQSTILSARDARATGADKDVSSSEPMAGIGGYTMLNVTRVRSMEVAGQQLGGFTAAIGQEGIPYTLLGQTEIARLGRIVIEDGVMTITPRALLQMAAR